MAPTPPSHYQLFLSEREIREAVGRVAREVGAWVRNEKCRMDRDLLVLPVLRGALFFFADFARALEIPIELAPVHASGYDVASNLGRAEVTLDFFGVDVKSRTLLIVDDICDTGKTLKALAESLLSQGAREVRSVVLVRRKAEDACYTPDWSGVEYSGSEWLVGYGMDDRDRWRNLPEVYVVAEGA